MSQENLVYKCHYSDSSPHGLKERNFSNLRYISAWLHVQVTDYSSCPDITAPDFSAIIQSCYHVLKWIFHGLATKQPKTFLKPTFFFLPRQQSMYLLWIWVRSLDPFRRHGASRPYTAKTWSLKQSEGRITKNPFFVLKGRFTFGHYSKQIST